MSYARTPAWIDVTFIHPIRHEIVHARVDDQGARELKGHATYTTGTRSTITLERALEEVTWFRGRLTDEDPRIRVLLVIAGLQRRR